MSVLDCVDLNNGVLERFSSQDNIVVCVFNNLKQLRGLHEFSKHYTKYKMLLFYYDSDNHFDNQYDNQCDNQDSGENSKQSADIMLRRVAEYDNIIPCKYTVPCGHVIQYVVMMTDLIAYKNAYICDIASSRYAWNNVMNSFVNVMKHQSGLNMYNVPLAGELLEECLLYSELGNIKFWHRITHNNMLIKPDNLLPIELLDKFVFETSRNPKYNKIDIFLCSIVEYIEENQIPFNYTIAMYTHRTPFYYWLEHVKPSKQKQLEFLNAVQSDAKSVRKFLEEYDHTHRKELYKKLQNVKSQVFEDTKVIECIKRFNQYLNRPDNTIYCKRW